MEGEANECRRYLGSLRLDFQIERPRMKFDRALEFKDEYSTAAVDFCFHQVLIEAVQRMSWPKENIQTEA